MSPTGIKSPVRLPLPVDSSLLRNVAAWLLAPTIGAAAMVLMLRGLLILFTAFGDPSLSFESLCAAILDSLHTAFLDFYRMAAPVAYGLALPIGILFHKCFLRRQRRGSLVYAVAGAVVGVVTCGVFALLFTLFLGPFDPVIVLVIWGQLAIPSGILSGVLAALSFWWMTVRPSRGDASPVASA